MARTAKRSRERAPARPSIGMFVARCLELGARTAKIVEAASIATAPWVTLKCQYGCDCYGTNLCCPPHTPRADAMRVVIDTYARAILFEAGRRDPKKIACDLEREVFLAGYYKAFGMGAGPCCLCKICPLDGRCRHAERARPAMEACGIDVFKTVRANGFRIDVVRNRADPQHYFGVVLVE